MGQPVLVGKRKAIALLLFLAQAKPHRATRGSLATLLWPDRDETRARSSLRQCLTEIRRAIPNIEDKILTITPNEVSLARSTVATDLDALLGGVLGDDVHEHLSASGALDRIFEGLWSIGEEFDSWLNASKDQVVSKLIEALTRELTDPLVSRQNVMRAARSIIAIDPLNEEACRMAMRSLAGAAEIGAALKVYSDLYEHLDQELGMEPSQATQELVVAIKTGEVSSGRPPVAATIAAPVPSRIILSGPPRLAIFPFLDVGPEPVEPFFVNGILEDTVSLLAQVRELLVYSSNTTRMHRTMGADGLQMPHGIDAEYLVTGTVRNNFGAYRITVELVDKETGLVEWSNIYSADVSELFEMQADIAENIAHQLVPSVSAAELRRIEGTLPEDLGAYHLMLRAREVAFGLNPKTFASARVLLETACERDPRFSTSALALADWLSVSLGQGWSDQVREDRQRLHETAERAVLLSGQSARALARFAHNRSLIHGFQGDAIDICRSALEKAPRDAETLLWTSPALTFDGAADEAIENIQSAIKLSPLDPFIYRFHHFLSIAEYAVGNFEAAAVAGQRSRISNPHYTSNLRMTAAALAELGQMDEAREIATEVHRLDPGFRVTAFLVNQPFKEDGIGKRYASRLLECGFKN